MKDLIVLKKNESTKVESFKTKSAQIRYLHSLGYSNGDISRYMSKLHNKFVRPQHVSNVIRTNVNNPTEK